MDGADGVAHGHLRSAAVLLGGLHGGFHVADIVQRVEAADDVDAVFDALFDEELHHIVSIVLVAQQVLATQQHLQLGVGQTLAQDAQALPRVFVQEAQAAVEGRATPALQRVVADLVQLGKHGLHLGGGHTRGGLTLVAVAQNGIGNSNLRHICHLSNHNQPNILSSIPAAIAEPITPATLGPMACISRKLPGLAFWPST